jgi:hypothetical protein
VRFLGLYKLFRAEIAQPTMGSFGVIMLSPILNNESSFA